MTNKQHNVILVIRVIINNNLSMRKRHTYLKSITLKKNVFLSINNRIDERYSQLEKKDCCFSVFYSWALLATILGIFTSYGDVESTRIFLSCIQDNRLPEISITKNKNDVKIWICVNEQKSKFKNTNK